MGMETPERLNGLGTSFMSTILAVEGTTEREKSLSPKILFNSVILELAKVDPAISVICDVQVHIKEYIRETIA